MKICAISDMHGYKFPIQECDVLAIAGDISNCGDTQWFLSSFLKYLEMNKSKFDICILTLGNHDDNIQIDEHLLSLLPKYLHILSGNSFTYKGKKFFGSPYGKSAPTIVKSRYLVDETTLKSLFIDIPSDTNVLLTHSPPYGYGDVIQNESCHLGSFSLACQVTVIKPYIHIFGHIHTGKKYTENNGTKFYNVSVLDENYKMIYEPTIIDYGVIA